MRKDLLELYKNLCENGKLYLKCLNDIESDGLRYTVNCKAGEEYEVYDAEQDDYDNSIWVYIARGGIGDEMCISLESPDFEIVIKD
jgi:hypothetical protein